MPDPALSTRILPGLDRFVCVADAMSSGQLSRCHGVDALSEVEARDPGSESVLEGNGLAYPLGVDRGGQTQGAVGLVLRQRPPVVLGQGLVTVSYTHLRAHETRHDLVC